MIAVLLWLPGEQSAAATRNKDIHPPPKSIDLPDDAKIGEITYTCKGGTAKCRISEFMESAKVCALLVVRDEKYRIEKFGSPEFCDEDGEINERKKLYGVASVAKSITSTLLGHAIATTQGARTRQDFEAVVRRPVGHYVPDLHRFIPSAYANVPLDQVLRMRSGVFWTEYGWNGFSSGADFFRQMVRKRQESVLEFSHRYVLRKPWSPTFNYSALDAAIAAQAADEMLGRVRLTEFLETGIWAAIGAESIATWAVDKSETAIGPCCFKATVGDLARFGLLVLRRGKDCRGNEIIPEAWFDIATKSRGDVDKIPPKNQSANANWPLHYGYFWWLNPEGTDFSAIGRDGQFIHIFPDSKTVVVQISDWGAWTNGDALQVESFEAHKALVSAIGRLP
ncbi:MULTISPECIES: serine hydrolase domain-containing protein [Ensifer]|uniref:serine hydrolase domain-containing protein n=1 Tax=Ensifer TaxID=106591 RepID=UPI00138F364A|nr:MULTISPECIES: serine hydrolase [unclassified Ensifer]